MPVTIIRTSPLPHCKYCKKQLDFYILGLPDEEHYHSDCYAKAKARESITRAFAKIKARDN